MKMDKTSWTYSKILYIKRKLSLLCQKTFDDLKKQDYFLPSWLKKKQKKESMELKTFIFFFQAF